MTSRVSDFAIRDREYSPAFSGASSPLQDFDDCLIGPPPAEISGVAADPLVPVSPSSDPLAPARGFLIGFLISLVLWALIANAFFVFFR